jgi:hypothetical protein
MANTLTKIAPILYSTAQEVSNEPFGVVNAINTQFDNQGVAKGDEVRVPVAPTRAASDFSPSNVSASGADATADNVVVQINKSRKVSWHLTGEQQRSLENGGNNEEWIRQLIAQGMRTLRNEAEVDAASAVHVGASRPAGEAGTTPFGSNLSELVNTRKILRDNGAPMSDLQLVVDTAAEVNLLNLNIIAQADQAGSDQERRNGRVLRQYGFQINQSAGIAQHSTGDAANIQLDGNHSEGAEQITLADGGTWSGAINAGDVITISGNSYVVVEGTADVTTDSTIVINRPGLLQDESGTTAVTLETSDFTPNIGLERESVVGVMRPPLIPANPTIEQMTISDDRGMSYLLLDIAQYGQRTWELHLAWGFKAVQPEHIALLMG